MISSVLFFVKKVIENVLRNKICITFVVSILTQNV